jgi:hypothetical protein
VLQLFVTPCASSTIIIETNILQFSSSCSGDRDIRIIIYHSVPTVSVTKDKSTGSLDDILHSEVFKKDVHDTIVRTIGIFHMNTERRRKYQIIKGGI